MEGIPRETNLGIVISHDRMQLLSCGCAQPKERHSRHSECQKGIEVILNFSQILALCVCVHVCVWGGDGSGWWGWERAHGNSQFSSSQAWKANLLSIHLVDNKYSVNIYYMPGVIVYETLANNMGEILSFYTSKLLYLNGSYSLILSLLNADIM